MADAADELMKEALGQSDGIGQRGTRRAGK
jgi:hypothetical protein